MSVLPRISWPSMLLKFFVHYFHLARHCTFKSHHLFMTMYTEFTEEISFKCFMRYVYLYIRTNRGYACSIIRKKNDQLRYCMRRLSKKLTVNDYHILYTKGWAANAAQAITHQQCYGRLISSSYAVF